MAEEWEKYEEKKKVGESTCGPSDNCSTPSGLEEQYRSTEVIPKSVIIDGKSYNSLNDYLKKSHKKYLFKVGENHYWAIGKKSELSLDPKDLFKILRILLQLKFLKHRNFLQIYILFGGVFVAALAGLAILLLRMKIFQAVKLGETA